MPKKSDFQKLFLVFHFWTFLKMSIFHFPFELLAEILGKRIYENYLKKNIIEIINY
jgi:hypothetical protein